MTVCKKCNGTGDITVPAEEHLGTVLYGKEQCDECDGTGEVQTNEEWFCQLPTEEKAKWLSQRSQILYDCGQRDVFPKTMYEEDWEWWLKQPHKSVTNCNE